MTSWFLVVKERVWKTRLVKHHQSRRKGGLHTGRQGRDVSNAEGGKKLKTLATGGLKIYILKTVAKTKC